MKYNKTYKRSRRGYAYGKAKERRRAKRIGMSKKDPLAPRCIYGMTPSKLRRELTKIAGRLRESEPMALRHLMSRRKELGFKDGPVLTLEVLDD